MGHLFSKDDVITNVTQSLPATIAPDATGSGIHAGQSTVAGLRPVKLWSYTNVPQNKDTHFDVYTSAKNPMHVAQESAAGVSDLAASFIAGLAVALIATARTAALSRTYTGPGINNDMNVALVKAGKRANSKETSMVSLDDGKEKVAVNSRFLAASGGRRCLKSIHGTYLRAHDREWKADMTSGPAKAWEKWYVEDWDCKVVFKAIHSPARFLRANPDASVDLVDRPQDWETWKPFKNNDGSWSFLSFHGKWLSARQDGSVTTVVECASCEHFWLERW